MLSMPDCIDKAVSALQAFSERDAVAMNDLAGAYFIRSRLKNQPADLLDAFEAAQHAMDATPRPPGAAFNLALIEEKLAQIGRAHV